MAEIIPFRAIRPVRDKVALVATRPVKDYASAVLKNKLKTNPYTFLHIINPENQSLVKTAPNTINRFNLIKQKYIDFKQADILKQDEYPCFYIYRQSSSEGVFTGIIACVSVKDYIDGVIKTHEKTLHQREEMFTEYLSVCEFNAEPVLMTFTDISNVDEFIKNTTKKTAEYDFTTTDKIHHELWLVEKAKDVDLVCDAFRDLENLYIADGHHRSASSVALATKFNKKKPYQQFLAYLLPESQLVIKPFHRAVINIKGKTKLEILSFFETQGFTIAAKNFTNSDIKKGTLGIYLEKESYLLHFDNCPEEKMDVALVSEEILAPLFDITHLETDNNISFIEGGIPLKDIQKRIAKGVIEMAIIVSSVTIAAVKEIADRGETMPPKSTYILPKLRNGLVVYDFS